MPFWHRTEDLGTEEASGYLMHYGNLECHLSKICRHLPDVNSLRHISAASWRAFPSLKVLSESFLLSLRKSQVNTVHTSNRGCSS